ncbi:hypothetical protein KUCAC02_001918 [Chaenocephalus aceratus]|uniref:Uncharacterized protein n=1 Tax=Chaenocephalus aceratus TaxID=36190 RepID=A0ACB9XSR2_CHAAC|nr:hypothetical protein KUCAC02_001918 [Chaenocephalus aceratus]
MKALQKELPRPEYIAAWVVLANQWPCRLSWILQCVEDAQQRADIELDNVPKADDSKTLWKVFQKSRAELYVMSAQIEDLLEQDGDPEMFEGFLTVDFKFTVKDVKTFEGFDRKPGSFNQEGAGSHQRDIQAEDSGLDEEPSPSANHNHHQHGYRRCYSDCTSWVVPSRLRQPYKNMAPTASHPQANPSGFHFHMPNQYSSNTNLVNGSM